MSDLHVREVGPEMYAAIISVVSDDPVGVGAYRDRLPGDLGIVHVSIEVQACDALGEGAPTAHPRANQKWYSAATVSSQEGVT